MCVAIFKPASIPMPRASLYSGWQKNPDGGGFAFYAGGKIHVQKGYMKLKDFLKAYETAEKKHPDAPFLIHFRIRSQGSKDADNTHPYKFKHGVAIHNGTLSGTGAASNTGKSDTALFLEKFSEDFTYDMLNDNKTEFNNAVGYNKLVFLFKDGKHLILNESGGMWREGVWYSNSYSLPDAATRSMAEAYGCDYE